MRSASLRFRILKVRTYRSVYFARDGLVEARLAVILTHTETSSDLSVAGIAGIDQRDNEVIPLVISIGPEIRTKSLKQRLPIHHVH